MPFQQTPHMQLEIVVTVVFERDVIFELINS